MASIFSRIVSGEMSAHKVYETDTELAFMDIHPKSPGHVLVIPKLEVASFEALPPERAAALAQTLQVVARGVTEAMGTPHYNLYLNNGERAGQVVFHVHFHVVPRYENRRPEEGVERLAERIRHAIRASVVQ